ncbi:MULTISPECIES: NmrA/HSCARG family protein [Gordonia]|uniref:NmrA/HSCARG family protein n=2 Tax=Gordonia TaxID=2053 RepID=A0A9X3D8B5_9ACTN|nr:MULTISPECIES: NmrA/HSCARG family protein [Gordonia]MCF3937069.1 NmrA/HSCARG family protein [Gordonia tangerina]MCX2966572.1 NmrA/HSCARG family protein [Gordonia aquimaris]
MTYVVLGATGGQGGAVAAELLEADLPVRAVVRDLESKRAQELSTRGIELVTGDMVSGDGLVDAFVGATGVFALTTPFETGVDAEITQGTAILDAARLAGVPYLVFSSVASADRGTGVPHFESKYRVEQALGDSGIPYTIVGPTYFYDNLLGSVDAVTAAGILPIAMPADTPLQQLSRRDLGRFVVELFRDPTSHVDERIDIASDSLTPDQMAAALSSVLTREVNAESYDPERISSPDMSAMFGFLSREGYQVDIPALHHRFPAVGWQSFAEWAAIQFGT